MFIKILKAIIHIFPKSINLKVKAIAWLEFKPAYYHHLTHWAMGFPEIIILIWNYVKND